MLISQRPLLRWRQQLIRLVAHILSGQWARALMDVETGHLRARIDNADMTECYFTGTSLPHFQATMSSRNPRRVFPFSRYYFKYLSDSDDDRHAVAQNCPGCGTASGMIHEQLLKCTCHQPDYYYY